MMQLLYSNRSYYTPVVRQTKLFFLIVYELMDGMKCMDDNMK